MYSFISVSPIPLVFSLFKKITRYLCSLVYEFLFHTCISSNIHTCISTSLLFCWFTIKGCQRWFCHVLQFARELNLSYLFFSPCSNICDCKPTIYYTTFFNEKVTLVFWKPGRYLTCETLILADETHSLPIAIVSFQRDGGVTKITF